MQNLKHSKNRFHKLSIFWFLEGLLSTLSNGREEFLSQIGKMKLSISSLLSWTIDTVRCCFSKFLLNFLDPLSRENWIHFLSPIWTEEIIRNIQCVGKRNVLTYEENCKLFIFLPIHRLLYTFCILFLVAMVLYDQSR